MCRTHERREPEGEAERSTSGEPSYIVPAGVSDAAVVGPTDLNASTSEARSRGHSRCGCADVTHRVVLQTGEVEGVARNPQRGVRRVGLREERARLCG
ncbi:hypothetical protein Tco_0497242 [Tanacetum coccineum]